MKIDNHSLKWWHCSSISGHTHKIELYRRRIIEYRIHAFILIRLSRVRQFMQPEFARIFVSRKILMFKMKYFLEIRTLSDNLHKKLTCLSVTCIKSVKFSRKRFSVLLQNNLYANFSTTHAIDECQQSATKKYYNIYEKEISVH